MHRADVLSTHVGVRRGPPLLSESTEADAAGLAACGEWYKGQLLEEVMPFWLRAVDRECGGYFTCIDGEHRVYDTDKYVWLQARQVWMLSKLAADPTSPASPEQRRDYTAAARVGAEFLRKHCDDPTTADGLFAVDRYGSPLVAPYSIFSDCFMCLALAQYSALTGEGWARDTSLRKFRRIEERWSNPKGKWSKAMGKRSFQSLGVPMIDTNVCVELLSSLQPTETERAELESRIRRNVKTVLEVHPDADLLLRENVGSTPEEQDTHDGRVFNPGHALECCWFLLEACSSRGMKEECNLIIRLARAALEKGWDTKYGGIFYFLDLKGKPLQQLEWDQKLWWVHLEALLCALWCYKLTKEREWWVWVCKLHQYIWAHFWDSRRGGEMW
eukprot:Hpha_TRINITY_DN7069_c0_g1::TRINITY_DN7069_c0_g1_i1::g.23035::m.23035/K01787/RENBP; N-acylglucosamine 2-epimerase